tara:strand:+ start:572 stop:1471 length:900 start_codon:yes stop_codon:yes gene_type:complete
MTPKQKKIASKAPPKNKIDGKDFAVLRAEKAKGRGMGLQDEKMKPGKIIKAKESKFVQGKGAQYRKYLRGLKDATKASSVKQMRRFRNTTTLEKIRQAKGFKPGETPAEFNKRKELAKFAKEGVKATRIGKIVLPIALAGVAGIQYLKSKIKKNEEKAKKKMGGGMMMKKPMMMSGGLSEATQKLKAQGKMGGGMMKRKPMMANKGKMATVEGKKKIASLRERAKKFGNRGKGILKEIMYGKKDPKGSSKYMGSFMGGGMMQRPMMAMGGGMMPGYKKGKSVMAKGCKLGRKKPTKMYT